MILIISSLEDSSTSDVIEWLDFLKKKWIRINSQDVVEIIFDGECIFLFVNGVRLNLEDFTFCWYRRGFINFKDFVRSESKDFEDLQKEEFLKLIEYFYFKLNKLKSLNSITNSDKNKLIVSSIARELNLLTPKDFIFSTLNDLKREFENESQKYLTKLISGTCVQSIAGFDVINYSKLIEIESIKTDNFFPSLVQNYIEKKYELRIFFIDGEFFSMAVFSQNSDFSKIDSRFIGSIKPRYVPFRIPSFLEKKLKKLMGKINLNCGSIDMIVTPNNEYVFLEVNPVGQFSMISYPCNYNLEKRIANFFNHE